MRALSGHIFFKRSSGRSGGGNVLLGVRSPCGGCKERPTHPQTQGVSLRGPPHLGDRRRVHNPGDAVFGEGLDQLPPEGRVDDAIDADIDGRAAGWLEIGSEYEIPDHEIFCVVLIAFGWDLGMVPPMESRGTEKPIEGARTQIDIAMGQEPRKGRHGTAPEEYDHRGSEKIERDLAEGDLEHSIGQMKPTGIDDPEARHTVMQGMKPPHERPFMGDAMGPIETELRDQHAENDLKEQGPTARPKGRSARCRIDQDGGFHGDGTQTRPGDLRQALAQEGVGDIVARFVIIAQPSPFIGINPLEKGDGDDDAQIDDIEPQDRVAGRKRKRRADNAD